MSTRCDFYEGRGEFATYLGSVSHDAHVDAMSKRFFGVTSSEVFKARLQEVLVEYGGSPASHGWPWPWGSSAMTDTVVAFDQGRCWTVHPSRAWAPLDDYEHPTGDACVFPNLGKSMADTPQGRLTTFFRHTIDLPSAPVDAVMSAVLCHVGELLTYQLIHGFWVGDSFYIPIEGNLAVAYERQAYAIRRVAWALENAAEDVNPLLAEGKAVLRELPWELLETVRETQCKFVQEEVKLTMGPDVSLLFGSSAPQSEYGKSYSYIKVSDPRFDVLYKLWHQLLDQAPIVYAQPLAQLVVNLGVLPVSRSQAVGWLSENRPEFGGVPLTQACFTREGRALALSWAANLCGLADMPD